MPNVNSVNALMARVSEFQFNPVAIQRAIMQTYSDITDGTMQVVDPTNPFVLALETSAVLTAAATAKTEVCTRRLYPKASLTYEDIYPHMSDKDYIGRFASPTTGKFNVLFSEEEILLKLVLDPATGIKKIVIPRNTYIEIAGNRFSNQYPIEIRQLVHGGLNIVYNSDVVSPLESLSTNVVDWEYVTDVNGLRWIKIAMTLQQFDIVSSTENVSGIAEMIMYRTLSDPFYYARVYVENDDGTWSEIRTTHTDLVYDVAVPTAVIKVMDLSVTISIPQIYITAGVVKNTVRVDLYQTKGPLNLIMSSYQMSDFGIVWKSIDQNDVNIFTAPLATIQQLVVYSDQVVNGGRTQLDFATLRAQVIRNSTGGINIPITPDQITNTLEDQNYEIVKNMDLITNRTFLATKPMPIPTNNKLITAAAASIETINLSMSVAALHPKVIDNGASITLTPDIVYRLKNGITSIVNQSEIDALLAQPIDKQALLVSQDNFLYTPFYYVLDSTGVEFDLRAYFLSEPEADTKLFVAENDTTLFQVVTDTYSLTKTPTGFKLRIATRSDDNWKAIDDGNVFVQLAYVPAGEKERAYLMGTQVGKSSTMERIYEFDLSSNMNVDTNDNLQLTKFMMFNTDARITGTPLYNGFDIVFGTTEGMTDVWRRGEPDDVLGMFLLPSNAVGITHEVIRIRFGQAMKTLWARTRSMVSTLTYKVWTQDIPRLYQEDIYAVFPDTGQTIKIVNGAVTYNITHHKGDPVLDETGAQVYLHRVGDPVLDEFGQPTPVDTRAMIRQVDIMMIEGAYRFATDSISTGYRTELVDTVVSWITNDLAAIQAKLLEQTRVYFYPKTTMGEIDVIIEDGLQTTIQAGQSFALTLYVSDTVYNNDVLKAELSTKTVSTISVALANSVLAISDVSTALHDAYGTDVIGIKMSGFGGTANLNTLTIVDDSKRCSIRKRLIAQADNSLIVSEDVVITFVRHQLTT